MKEILIRLSILLGLVCLLMVYSCKSKTHYREVMERDGLVSIDLSEIKDAVPAFYSFKTDKGIVDFFILKIGDNIETYLDACMKCYPHRMGFRVDGFYLECKYCNVRYPLDTLKEGAGSCYPIPLKGEVKGDRFVIKAELLKESVKYF